MGALLVESRLTIPWFGSARSAACRWASGELSSGGPCTPYFFGSAELPADALGDALTETDGLGITGAVLAVAVACAAGASSWPAQAATPIRKTNAGFIISTYSTRSESPDARLPSRLSTTSLMHRLASFLVAFTAAVSVACSSNNESSADMAACTDIANARCSRIASCSSAAMTYRFPDMGTCESLFLASCLGALAAPSAGVTSAWEETCSQTIANANVWSCDDFLFNQNIPAACVVPAGTVASGAPCAFDTQCESSFCAIVPGSACGTCAAATQPGDSCAHLAACATTQTCEASNMQCVAFAALGQACGTSQPCAGGLSCTGGGMCEPALTTVKADCPTSGPGCDFYQDLTCNQQSGCEPVPFVGAGQPCGYIQYETVSCEGGAQCIASVCAAAAPVGQPCDLVSGPVCIAPSRCILSADAGATKGTCQISDATKCQ